MFGPMLGVSLGVSLRVGRFMGARDAGGALLATRVVFFLVGCYALIASSVIGGVHSIYAAAFVAPDSEAAKLVAAWSPILCCTIVFDSLQTTSGGVLRGLNRPVVGALSGMVSYLVIGIPLAYVFGKSPLALGLPGIWAGITCAVASAFFIMGLTLARLDWTREANSIADAAGVGLEVRPGAAVGAASVVVAGGDETKVTTEVAVVAASA